MVLNQKRSKRKPTGARYKQLKVRRQHENGTKPVHTKVDENKSKFMRTIGGNQKNKLLAANTIIVNQAGKTKTAKILSVSENKANRNFERRNIITKGSVVETDMGLVQVTSRPGQTNSLNGILVK